MASTSLGSIGALYNLTMDPYEKYDSLQQGSAGARPHSVDGAMQHPDNPLPLLSPKQSSKAMRRQIELSAATV